MNVMFQTIASTMGTQRSLENIAETSALMHEFSQSHGDVDDEDESNGSTRNRTVSENSNAQVDRKS